MTIDSDCIGAQADDRRVVLIKSQRTNNRFYTLVRPDSGIRNADIVPEMPAGSVLGIAYPCLEDGLNDFAVIRTTFETLDFFPDEDEMRSELMGIVQEARRNLILRLAELRDDIGARRAHFLGSDLDEFKSYSLDVVYRGYPRRNLDSMMKLNVFSTVAEHEEPQQGSEPLYYYEMRNPEALAGLAQEPAHVFVAALFGDVLGAVEDDANYRNRYTFDRNVFQKFIALMFVNYATTDPIFYGTNKADYGVSADRDMGQTPLYVAVARELRGIEARLCAEAFAGGGVDGAQPLGTQGPRPGRLVQLPGTTFDEDVILRPLTAVCSLSKQLAGDGTGASADIARRLAAELSTLVREMRDLGMLSAAAADAFSEAPTS